MSVGPSLWWRTLCELWIAARECGFRFSGQVRLGKAAGRAVLGVGRLGLEMVSGAAGIPQASQAFTLLHPMARS